MRAEEFTALAQVEREHWFYRGKRDIVRHWVRTFAPVQREDLLVDIGAGTGQMLSEWAATCRAVGIEFDATGLGIATQNAARLVQASAQDLPLASGCAAVVTALDVLEHLDDDARALAELTRITRPGGLIVLLVPALRILWSDWDDALGHKRRYTKDELLRLVRAAPLTILHCAYVNSFVFLPILLYRIARSRFGIGGGNRLEDSVPPAAINRALHALFVAPACWRWFSPPFGVSVLCVLRRD